VANAFRPKPAAGALIGLFAGMFLCFVAGIMILLGGHDNFVEMYGINIVQLFGLYLGGGLCGGMVVGALLPVARWRWSAGVLGVIAVTPLYLGVAWMGNYPWYYGVVPAAIVGGALGVRTFNEEMGD